MHAPLDWDSAMKLFEAYGLPQLIQETATDNWSAVWEKFNALYHHNFSQDNVQRHILTDLFMAYCLSQLPAHSFLAIWEVVEQWHSHHKLPERYPAMPKEEQVSSAYFCLKLREKLHTALLLINDDILSRLPENHQQLMLTIWQQIFLNLFSPLYILDTVETQQMDILPTAPSKQYVSLLAASMFFATDADDFMLDSTHLLAAPIPLAVKTLLIRWMVYIPYFSGTMKQRDRLMHYIPKICQALLNKPELISQVEFVSFVQAVMTGLWRASYIGGNNLPALAAFGDFITTMINQFCPPLPPISARSIRPGEKIRIGYISRNFFQQAVSLYMINRLIYHDRNQFEVFVFSLGDYQDSFTDLFRENSDHFFKFPDLQNFSAIINSVISSKVDILIYTDIGMDVVTYIIAGLRLAPVQCALVGHGTSTGLPSIDYYISGDFEAPSADTQYRETLIRLPALGAAQYLPAPPVQMIKRSDLGIPADAVVFISCANGIKHRPERDGIYIEILKQAANAWVILKPYTTKDGIDSKLATRLRTLASAAGVANRLIILPSLGHYRNVLGLLGIADIQLDTFPYGGWTTNLEALFMGLPLLTQEGELSRSRWGASMLRLLGITEGIAQTDEEYIAWAIRFASEPELRRQISSIIKEKALPLLFNGPAAQPAYENELRQLVSYEQTEPVCSPSLNNVPSWQPVAKPPATIVKLSADSLYVATSIAPHNYDNQRAALATWLQAGFKVLSLNTPTEINQLRPKFPGIEFIAVQRTAYTQFQKPYIFFDDIRACLKQYGPLPTGIINSDIYLTNDTLRQLTADLPARSLLFGSRLEVSDPAAKEGKLYQLGFDFFFLGHQTLNVFPCDQFCLGLPWWDYWAVLMPLTAGCQVKRLVTPIALHISHSTAWNLKAWYQLGLATAKYFPPGFPLEIHTMPQYVQSLAKKIHVAATDVIL